MIKHIDIIIHGKVQEIGFGFQTMMAASKNNVKGKINFSKSGFAYIEAEASPKELDYFIKSFKEIPKAIISDIEIKDGKIRNYPDFEIY